MGFTNQDYTGTNSYTSDNVIGMYPAKYVSIQIPELGLYGHSTDDCKYTILLPIDDENRANVVDFTTNTDYNQCIFSSPRNIFNLSVSITAT